jgi:hypothetical protein
MPRQNENIKTKLSDFQGSLAFGDVATTISVAISDRRFILHVGAPDDR